MAQEIVDIVLDSLDKVKKFSNRELIDGYSWSAQLQPYSVISNLTSKSAGGQVQIQNLYNTLIDKNLDLEDDTFSRVRIPFVYSEVLSLEELVGTEFGINLKDFGRKCERGDVETYGKRLVVTYPIINLQTFITDGRIESFRRITFTGTYSDAFEYRDERKSIVLSTISPDLIACPEDKVYKFYANNQNWGVVNLNTKLVKSVTVENRGDEKLTLSKYRFSDEKDTHFKVVNLNLPVTIQPKSILSFDVEYYPGDEPGIVHTNDIIYAVFEEENAPFINAVREEKLSSKLSGKSGELDLIDTIEDDLGDWLKGDDNGTYVIKTISRIVDKSSPIEKWETRGLWKCEGEKLNTFFSSSIVNPYYLSVYNKSVGTTDSFKQFDISFGHKTGLGSKFVSNGIDFKPSRVMYKKYLQQCYEPEPTSHNERPTKFKFKNGVNGDYAYFIQMNRDDFKDMLDPGNFELCLSPLSGSSNQFVNTGSNVQIDQNVNTVYTLIDESWDAKQAQSDGRNLRDWYYVTSGSKKDGVYAEEGDNAWGVVFPKLGLIVLDGVVLDQSCSFNTVTASIDGENSHKLFLAISGSSSTTIGRQYTGSFFARSAEKKIVETYFCRISQDEFNYSTNPTYTSGSLNALKYTYFKDNPHSYVTTIGLYTRKGVLVAVGKLKQPILKNVHKSYVFQVRVKLN